MHPSELAMQHRVEVDRSRRRRFPALALIGLGAAVLAGGVVLGWGWVPAVDQTATPPEPPSNIVPVVLVNGSGTTTQSGLVVGDDGMIVTRSATLDPSTEVWVLAAGRNPVRAEVAGTDESLGIAVVDPASAIGKGSDQSARVRVGDTVVVYSATGPEQAPVTVAAEVTAVGVDEQLADDTVRQDLVLLQQIRGAADDAGDGPRATSSDGSCHDGVVYDQAGRLVGMVVSRRVGSGDIVVARSRSLEPSVAEMQSLRASDDNQTRFAATTEPGG